MSGSPSSFGGSAVVAPTQGAAVAAPPGALPEGPAVALSPGRVQGQIQKAFALRQKYHVASKIQVPLRGLVVQPMNRAGVYPNGGAVQTLGCRILGLGFSEETANAEGVIVQEIPGPEQASLPIHPLIKRGADGKYLPYMDHNRLHTQDVPQLRSCFDVAHQGSYGTLSHSHLLLVLLAVSTGAKWVLEDEDPLKKFQDEQGLWQWSRLAEKDHALANLVKDGLVFELLSWELYRDYPEGAMLISASLNRGHNLGLKQSEIEALKVLAGQMPSVQGTAVAETFVYEHLLQQAHPFLDTITEDPDFPELAGFVASMGGQSGPWIAEYERFANLFVNSQERRLRLAAFAVVNKMPDQAPRAKLAVIFRAYRQKPGPTGLCPTPEPAFGEERHRHDVASLEEVLYYWWKTCAQVLDSLRGSDGHVLRTNATIRAAEVCARHWAQAGQRIQSEPLTKKLLQATREFWQELPEKPAPRPQGKWVDYSAVAEGGPKKEAEEKKAPPMILPRVLAYDAEGAPLAAQEVREVSAASEKAGPAVAEVPFRQWLNTTLAEDMDVDATYQGAIHTVLHSLHLSEMAQTTDIRVIFNTETKTKHVQASRDIPAGKLRLPPCAPQKLHLQKASVHPHKVAITVTRQAGGFDGEEAQTYYIRAPGGESPTARPP